MNSGTHRWPCLFNVGNGYFNIVTETESDIVFILNWTAEPDVVNCTSTINWEAKVQLKGFENTRVILANDTWAEGCTGIVVGNTGPGSSFTDFTFNVKNQDNSATIATTRIDNLYTEVLVGETKTIATGTCIVPHEDDGTKDIYFSCTCRVDNSFLPYTTPTTSGERSGYRGDFSTNYFALDSIATHAIITGVPVEFSDEDVVPIEYAMPSGTTGKIYLSLDGDENTETTELKTVTGAGTYNYSFSETDQKKLWKIQDQGLVTKRVRFFIKSISNLDGEEYKEPSNWINLHIANYMPTLNPEVWDTNADTVDRLTGDKYKLVRYVSNAAFTTGGQPNKGASIQTQVTYNNGISRTGPSGTFEKVTGKDTSTEFDFTITDSYGRNVQQTMQFSTTAGNYVPYVKLTSNVEATPMTAEGKVQVKITGQCFNGSFGKKINRLRVFYNLAKNNEDDFDHRDLGYADYASNYGNSFSVDGNNYTYTLNIADLEYLSVYDLTVWVADEVATAGVSAFTVLASTPIFDWGRTDFNFNVPVTIQGWQVDTVVEESTGEIGFYEDASGLPQYGGFEWTFRKWSSGLMECWCSLPITTNVSTTWGGLYTSGRLIKTNLLFPREFAEVPVVTATLAAGYTGGILMTTGSSAKPVTTYSAGTLEIARGTSITNASYTINYIVKGRWK